MKNPWRDLLPPHDADRQFIWERNRRIIWGLERGAKPKAIAKAFDVSPTIIYQMRERMKRDDQFEWNAFKRKSPLQKFLADRYDFEKLGEMTTAHIIRKMCNVPYMYSLRTAINRAKKELLNTICAPTK